MPDNRPEEKKLTLDISYTTFIRLIVVFLVLFLVYLLREVILILFLAIILTAALIPSVRWLQTKKIPRLWGIIIIYAVLVGLVALVIGIMIPPMANQIAQLQQNFPQYFETLTRYLEKVQATAPQQQLVEGIRQGLGTLGTQLGQVAGTLYQAVANVFAGIVSAIVILVLAFYFTLQEEALPRFIKSITPSKYQSYISSLVIRMQTKMGDWLRGQAVLCVTIGVLCFLGLKILGVKYALALGAFAGITEVIPYVGPIIGALPAIFIAFVQQPWLTLLVIILYVVVQQLENHILVPKIMERAVGLNPIVVILVILIGAKLAGILGAIIAVPVATAISIFLRDLLEMREKEGKFAFPEEKSKKIA